MSTQIAVRLPDDLIRYVDEQVAAGHATSRAALVTRALERERRRAVAARDAEILAAAADEEGFDGLAGYAAAVGLPDLD
jgi:Arc/MetJ-type ribon-helix-helix transcriptional regulator